MALDVNSHDDNIVVNIVLAPAPIQAAGFGNVVLIVDQVTNTLNGARIITYTGTSAANTDFNAGFISAETLAAVTVAFSQAKPPQKFKVARQDTVGTESLSDAFEALRLVDSDVFGVAVYSRVDADTAAFSTAIEAKGFYICGLQSSNADWKTTGYPAALAAVENKEQTGTTFHDIDAEWGDVGWLVRSLAIADPDVQSAPWQGEVKGVAQLATAPTQAEKDFLDGNQANHGLQFPAGRGNYFVDPGRNAADRPMEQIVTKAWLATRITERLSQLILDTTSFGTKIVLDQTGQALGLAQIQAQFAIGEATQHFVPGQTSVVAEPISVQDTSLQRLRYTARGQFAVSLRKFQVDINLSSTPITE